MLNDSKKAEEEQREKKKRRNGQELVCEKRFKYRFKVTRI